MHQCLTCKKWFPRPSGLATHMNVHSGAKRELMKLGPGFKHLAEGYADVYPRQRSHVPCKVVTRNLPFDRMLNVTCVHTASCPHLT